MTVPMAPRLATACQYVTWLLEQYPELCEVDDYVRASGLPSGDVREALGWLQAAGWVRIHNVNTVQYVDSRGARNAGLHYWPPNRWANLCMATGEDLWRAHGLAQTVKGLEVARWSVTTQPATITSYLGRMANRPPYALGINGRAAPVIHHPSTATLKDQLADLWKAGASIIVIVAQEGADLEALQGEVRTFLVDRDTPAPLTVLLLPAPGYPAIIITGYIRSVEGTTQVLGSAPPPQQPAPPPEGWVPPHLRSA